MKKNKKRLISIIATSIFLLSCIFASALQRTDIQVTFKKVQPIDVVLSVGKSTANVSNFKTDLLNSLASKGITSDRVNITAIQATSIDAKSAFSWETHDYGGGHISNDGTNIKMIGYTEPPYKNWMFMPDTNKGKKTFTFTLAKDTTDWHSMEGGGFLFNTIETGGNISGYAVLFTQSGIKLDKINNVSISSLNGGSYGLVENAGTLLGTYTAPSVTNHNLKIEVTPTTINMWDTGTKVIDNYKLPTDFGSYGYGPITSFASHGCNQISYFTFGNIVMTVENSKELSEVIRQPSWRNNTCRFLVDLEDDINPDFNDTQKTGEVLTRLYNQQINYIGWGTDTNKAQLTNLVNRNDGNGTFTYNTNYSQGITDITNYILSKIGGDITGDPLYLIQGDKVEISSNPLSIANNTSNSSFPQGMWKYKHNYTYFDNNMGQSSQSDIWQNNVGYFDFTNVGQYELFYGNDNPTPHYVYVHRKPIANFTVDLSPSGSNYVNTLYNNSYDPDMVVSDPTNKGIVQSKWQWRKVADTSWYDGLPPALPNGDNYLIKLTVQDKQGQWSDPLVKYVSTTGIAFPPVASFEVSPSPDSKYDNLTFVNTAYDPSGLKLDSYVWTIYNTSGTAIWSKTLATNSAPFTSFTSIGLNSGSYIIGLKVANTSGIVSQEYQIPITTTEDTSAPTSIFDPTSSSWINKNILINYSFNDQGGSGFYGYRYAISPSTSCPTTGWSDWNTSSTGQIILSTEGQNYIYIEAKDNAGNLMKRTLGTYNIDKTNPTGSISKSTISWTNGSVTLTTLGSDATSGVKSLQNPDSTVTSGNKSLYTVNSNGDYSFTISDNAGNQTVTNCTVTNIDKNAPALTLTTDTNLFTNKNITINANAFDDQSGVSSITLPDGKVVSGTSASYFVTNNGTYTFSSVDNVGNVSTTSIEINNIVYINNVSDIDHIEYKLDGATVQDWTVYPGSLEITNEGITEISVRAIDKAGNVSDTATSVVKIDRSKPINGNVQIIIK